MFKQLISILCFIAFITSCTKEAATFEQPNQSLMQDFKTNFSVSNLQNESWVKAIGTIEANDAKISSTKLDDGRAASFIMLPINNSEGIQGIAYVVKVGNTFKSLIADGTKFKNGKGEVSYYSSKGLMLKEVVADYKIKAVVEENTLSTRAVSTGGTGGTGGIGISTEPTEELKCWQKRYAIAKNACEADAGCRSACDFADMFGSQCTGSMMAAAVISCWWNP
jgi:hypothetical protein